LGTWDVASVKGKVEVLKGRLGLGELVAFEGKAGA
jgi:hypothetical protein